MRVEAVSCQERGSFWHLDPVLPGSTHRHYFDIISSSLRKDFQNKLNHVLEREELEFGEIK